MINCLKLLWFDLFGSKSEHLDGCTLFAGEYTRQEQFDNLNRLYGAHPVVRVPFTAIMDGKLVRDTVLGLVRSGISDIVILLDQYCSHQSMMDRLNFIRSELPQVKMIQLFNELPHMQYAGEPILTLQSLCDKTNQYADWIHVAIPGATVISMAPYNCMDETDEAWGVTNVRILKDLILYTTVDVTAMHLYGDTLGRKMDLMSLADDMTGWLDEAKVKKRVWVTECGADGWGDHIAYYRKMVRLFCNVIGPEMVFWYRQAVKDCGETDNGFALDHVDTGNHSPLWGELT